MWFLLGGLFLLVLWISCFLLWHSLGLPYSYCTKKREAHRLTLLYKIQNNLLDIDPEPILKHGDSRGRGRSRWQQSAATSTVCNNPFYPRAAPVESTTCTCLHYHKKGGRLLMVTTEQHPPGERIRVVSPQTIFFPSRFAPKTFPPWSFPPSSFRPQLVVSPP